MKDQTYRQKDTKDGASPNRDPITGAPGAHPVGAGVGTTGGAVAGAAIGAVAGPIGAAVGLVAGGIIGGLTGKGVAEQINPTAEDAYWRANFQNQKYVEKNAAYTTYQPAYRTGYEGRRQYPDKKYEDVAAELQSNYEKSKGSETLSWDKAQPATRAAWHRFDQPPTRHEDGSKESNRKY